MSRVGKKDIILPDGVDVDYNGNELTVKGKKGVISLTLNPNVDLSFREKNISVVVKKKSRDGRALQGLTRSLVYNMTVGVSLGFEKSLEINGIGYKVELKGRDLLLNLGYSHPIEFKLPDGVDAVVERNLIKLSSIDKCKLGQAASSIRQLKPPEPYKGKGIKYVDEYVRRKAGKTGTK